MEYRNRKHPRCSSFDYSNSGAYFITICTTDKKQLFSYIEKQPDQLPTIKLKPCGEILQQQLLLLEDRYPHVKIARYVIMPEHIHILLHLKSKTAEEQDANLSRADLNSVICTFKSLTVRMIKKQFPEIESVFQTSFFEHIIRNPNDYRETEYYIVNNPVRRYYKT